MSFMDSSLAQKNEQAPLAGKWMVCMDYDKKKKRTQWRVGRIKNITASMFRWEFEYLGGVCKNAAEARKIAEAMNAALA